MSDKVKTIHQNSMELLKEAILILERISIKVDKKNKEIKKLKSKCRKKNKKRDSADK